MMLRITARHTPGGYPGYPGGYIRILATLHAPRYLLTQVKLWKEYKP